MRFLKRSEAALAFEGKSVAIVGSGPGVLGNAPGFVDGYDVVVRVNNYKLSDAAGHRCDVFYSFFGTSIRKTRGELIADGVKLCLCKLPNADMTARSADNPSPLDGAWHRKHSKMIGLDYRPHYTRRASTGFWFCDTYVPSIAEFRVGFDLLGRHMPTTGFAAILDVLSFKPRSVFLTGFDFFASGIHNVDEPWVHRNHDDPYRHAPDRERAFIAARMNRYPISVDAAMARAMEGCEAACSST